MKTFTGFIILLTLFWLILSWFANSVGLKAEEITTDNLIVITIWNLEIVDLYLKVLI